MVSCGGGGRFLLVCFLGFRPLFAFSFFFFFLMNSLLYCYIPKVCMVTVIFCAIFCPKDSIALHFNLVF